MRIVFLDFDGVILSIESRLGVTMPSIADHTVRTYFSKCADLYKATPRNVMILNKITDSSKAKIVISSNWRLGLSFKRLKELLATWGVTGHVIGVTPRLGVKQRFSEIALFLKTKNYKSLESYVILDDYCCNGITPELRDRLVLTSFDEGLTEEHFEQASKILQKVL